MLTAAVLTMLLMKSLVWLSRGRRTAGSPSQMTWRTPSAVASRMALTRRAYSCCQFRALQGEPVAAGLHVLVVVGPEEQDHDIGIGRRHLAADGAWPVVHVRPGQTGADPEVLGWP